MKKILMILGFTGLMLIVAAPSWAVQPIIGWHPENKASLKYGQESIVTNDSGMATTYRYVINRSDTALSKGMLVCYSMDSAPAEVAATNFVAISYSVVLPDSSTTFNYQYFAGVVVDSIDNNNAGWIVVNGPCEAYTDTVAAGSLLKIYSAYAGSTTYDYLTTAATKATLAGASGAASITQYAMGPKAWALKATNQPSGRGLSWIMLQR